MNENLEVVIRLIEEEDRYHEKKETMAWTVGAFYFAFSGAITSWLWNNPLCPQFDVVLGLVLGFIYFSAVIFASLQFRSRWESVNRSSRLNRILRTMKPQLFPQKTNQEVDSTRKPLVILGYTFIFPILALFIIFPYRICKKCKKDLVDTRYLSEVPVYTIMFVLFAVQIAVLILK